MIDMLDEYTGITMNNIEMFDWGSYNGCGWKCHYYGWFLIHIIIINKK